MRRTATAIAVLGLALVAPGSAHAASCSGFSAVVVSNGATVSQLNVHGVDCGTARKIARQWLSGLSRRDAYVYCAPPAGAPSETCTIGHYSCRASGVSGAPTPADTMRCHYGRRTMSWRASFDEQPNGDEEEL